MKKRNFLAFGFFLALFLIIAPFAYKFGQDMARDGMNKALEENARLEANSATKPAEQVE